MRDWEGLASLVIILSISAAIGYALLRGDSEETKQRRAKAAEELRIASEKLRRKLQSSAPRYPMRSMSSKSEDALILLRTSMGSKRVAELS